MHPKTREPVAIKEDVLQTLERLRSHAAVLGSQSALTELAQIASGGGNHASWLRQQHGYAGVEGVVQAAVGALRA